MANSSLNTFTEKVEFMTKWKILFLQKNYKKSIDLGRNTNYFFAAKSALQLAFIHEKKGEKTRLYTFLRMYCHARS